MIRRYDFGIHPGQLLLEKREEMTFSATGAVVTQVGRDLVPQEVNEMRIVVGIGPETDPNEPAKGRLSVMFRGEPPTFYPAAENIARDAAEHLAFFYRGLRLAAFIGAFAVPETDEEIAAAIAKPVWRRIVLAEVADPIPLTTGHLRTFPNGLQVIRLVRQYNAARNAANDIDAFLNAYKVLETLYHTTGSAKAAFKTSTELREFVRQSFRVLDAPDGIAFEPTDADVDRKLEEFVEIRHSCAHLKETNAFGFVPGDRQALSVIRPQLPILTTVARRAILHHMGAGPQYYGA